MRVLRRLACLLLFVAPAVAAPAPPAHAAVWTWPVPAPHLVVRGFAPPAHDWLPGHRGVDLAAADGAPVVAAGAGRVVVAGSIGGVGVVAVRHPDGLETTYEPVRPAVRVGAVVALGALVGHVTGPGHCATQSCLHWGLRRGATYLDPLQLVGAGRVRLLPLDLPGSAADWVLPAASGASVGSSVLVVGWALRTRFRRRRRLPAGVADLTAVRARRSARVDPAAS